MASYQVDANGFYGDFGGAFVPEMLYTNVSELDRHYLNILEDTGFQSEFRQLLRDYSGRPCGWRIESSRDASSGEMPPDKKNGVDNS